MGVKKTYTYAEVKSAIDIADKKFFNTLIRVRSDVSIDDWGKSKIKVTRNSAGKPLDPLAWRGRGGDIGHTFRHVDDTAPTGKSVYKDDDTAVRVTMELLNSSVGQSKLEALDNVQPDTIEPDSTNNRKIVAAVTGDWYGSENKGGTSKKIKKAACQIMKLGNSTLWVHTTYPTQFITS